MGELNLYDMQEVVEKGSVIRNCEVCGGIFKVKSSWVRRGRGRYCGSGCFSVAKAEMVADECPNCGVHYRIRRMEKAIGRRGCSVGCRKEMARKARLKVATMGEREFAELVAKVRVSKEGKLWEQKVKTRGGHTCVRCGAIRKWSAEMEAHRKIRLEEMVGRAIRRFPSREAYDACMRYKPLWRVKNGECDCVYCHSQLHAKGRRNG